MGDDRERVSRQPRTAAEPETDRQPTPVGFGLAAGAEPESAARPLGEFDESDEADEFDGLDELEPFDDVENLERFGDLDLDDIEEGISTSALRRVIDGVLGRVLSGIDVRRVFGEPVTQGGVTVIPVAEVRYGFGFGGGGGEDEDGETGGAGGGGAVSARPIGFVELRDGAARFEPIVDVTRIATVGTVVGGLAIAVVLRRLLR